jgi:hypothetical protein
MTMPLRKDQAEAEQLTTADLAGTRTANDVAQADVEAGRAKPVRSERNADLQAEPRPGSAAADSTPLFPDDQLKDLQARWDDIQTGFVDEPRSAVEHADSLVASTMQQLAEAFARSVLNSNNNGIAATISQPKICAWPFSAIAHSFGACYRCSGLFKVKLCSNK